MAEQTIKIGIVGAGIWGRNHALVLATHPRAKSSSAIAMKVALGRWQTRTAVPGQLALMSSPPVMSRR